VKLYTLGYQGLDVCTYVRTLQGAGVGVVVDVRETPWSYKRSFCKSALSLELSKAGIEYIHVRSAGNPKENRRTAPTREECLKRYRKHLRSNPEAVTDLMEVIKLAAKQKKSTCLTCYEKEPHECHRSILATALHKSSADVTAIHLQALAEEKVRPFRVPQTDNHETVRV
jgi:uncharacterized protein (DUF488 family)